MLFSISAFIAAMGKKKLEQLVRKKTARKYQTDNQNTH